MKIIYILLIYCMLPALCLAQTGVFTGGNSNQLNIRVERNQQSFEYVSNNLEGRLNSNQEQLEMLARSSSPQPVQEANNTIPLWQLLQMDSADSTLAITLQFPGTDMDFRNFKGQNVTFQGTIRVGSLMFRTPVEVTGYYKNNMLIVSFDTVLTGEAEEALQAINMQALQIYAKGVSINVLMYE